MIRLCLAVMLVVLLVEQYSAFKVRGASLRTSSVVLAKKKKASPPTPSGGGAKSPVTAKVGTTAKAGKKGDIRVKLNMDVKNVGKKGEVVFVSGAMFNNVLGPQKQASRVSDEENAANIASALEGAKQAEEAAAEMKTKIEAIKGAVIERNVGPDGSLFGVAAGKHILEHLKTVSKINLQPKSEVKEICTVSESGTVEGCLDGIEAKKAGSFVAKVKLNDKVPLVSYSFVIQPGEKK